MVFIIVCVAIILVLRIMPLVLCRTVVCFVYDDRRDRHRRGSTGAMTAGFYIDFVYRVSIRVFNIVWHSAELG